MKKTLPQTSLNTFLCCCFAVPKSCPTLCDPMDYSMPCFPGLHYCPKSAQTNAHWVNDAIQPSHSLLPCLLLSSIFPASGSFPIESALGIRWPKHWRFSFCIGPSNEYSGLISFRIGWLISLLSKMLSRVFSCITVQKHEFFGTQSSLWSNYYIHTRLLEKPWLWLIWPFVGQLMSLLFNTLSRFVIAFVPRIKGLLISLL